MELIKKYLPVAIAGLAGVLIGGFVFGGWGRTPNPADTPGFVPGAVVKGEKNCKTTEETMTVSGDSLAGIIKNGDKVKVIKNYYTCNDAKRGDIVVYGYAAGTQLLVKIVKAIPGDKWELKKSGTGWNIIVNGAVLKTSDGKPYLISEQSYRLLSLYTHDYNSVIPGDAYLILGNEPGGSLDSTRFGLVGRSDFVGKVQK